MSEPKGRNTDYLWLAVPPGKKPHLGRRLAQRPLRFVLNRILNITVQGIEHFPMQGPTIVIFNHLHFFDPNVMAAYMPRYAVPVSKEENFAVPVQGWLLYTYGAIGVKRHEIDRVALKAMQAVLDAGNVLMMAPEGTRSRSNSLQEAAEGFAFVAQRGGQPVIQPVGQWGYEALGHYARHLQRTPVTLNFGRPFRFRKMEKRSRDAVHHMTSEAMYQIASLLPPAYRGVYSDMSQATTQWIEFV